LIFLLDTTAFLALAKSNVVPLALNASEILDVVVAECHHPEYLDAHDFVRLSGLQKIETISTWTREATSYRSPSLSFQDCLTLYYAKFKDRILVTDSGCLTSICKTHNLPTYPYQNFRKTVAETFMR
jgi:hypothetical protein